MLLRAAHQRTLNLTTLTRSSSMLSPSSASPPPYHAWRSNPPSATPPDAHTYKADHALPRLPVPDLDTTLQRLARSCSPLATETQRRALDDKIRAFGREGGVGQKLQKQLVKRREEPERRNWLAQWWDELGYMQYRDSVVGNVSYYYGFDRLPQSATNPSSPSSGDPAYVAASIAKTALDFRRLLMKSLLEPDLAGRKPSDGTLCMESYKWAFNACRVPAQPGDYAVKVAEDSKEAQHFVVVKKNRFYSVPIAHEGHEYGVEQLRSAIQSAIARAEKEGKGPAVGVLTGVNRDHWTEAHSHLVSSPVNVSTFESIQTAAFVICLDEASPTPSAGPEGMADFSKRLWLGGEEGGNRWWDKPLQWIVYKNGESGFVGEHSCMDGTPTARLNDFISSHLLTAPPSHSPCTCASPTPVPLRFDLDSTSLNAITAAETEFAEHIEPYDVHYLSYQRYGKDGIKAMGASPDGWVQMLFQLAYYMTYDRPTATYEAAQTRRFQLGRTETVRILTPEALAFVTAVLSPTSSSSPPPPSKLLDLFRAALAAHGSDMRLASAGMGIDRHLFGLKVLAAELEDEGEKREVLGMEEGLLSDEVVKESGTWRMSTSQIYIRRAPSYGWGPVVADGFGLPYMIHPESLQLTVTCDRSLPGAQYLANFEKAADLLMDLHEKAKKEVGSKL